ncbi:MAG: efflux RND transporter permease subunit [Gemmatimonadetes bacterium]|nr:efflux RND transporter permease subunit [Gemmatimonadota bacterium]
MGSLALVLFGVLGYLRLPVRELPDIDPPIVSVETSLRGANPRVMESSVTDVLEEELSTAEGIRTLTSSSNEQRSSVRLEFGLSRDVESAAQDVRDLVSRVRGRLPEDVDEPVVAKQDADARPFYYLALTSTTLDLLQLNDVADRIVKQRLQTIPGVARAQIQGERRYAMKIWLDQNALTARSLTVQDVAAAIRARNVEVPAGRIESSQREFTVRSLGELRTPNEFSDLVVSSQGGVLTKLRDVGRVELGPANDRSALRFDQMPGIGLGVIRQSKANVIEVSKAIQAALPSIQAALPPGVKLVQAFDQSVFVERSIRDAQRTLIEAALLVVVIIFLFLRNLRATIIPAFAIPASIIATFAVMSALGFSINNFTLLALTIAIGIVVDDAIIVLENAYRHQEELGKSPEQAARDGTREIGFAVVATTASLMAVFVPLAFLKGNTGKLFNEFGIAVAGSVFISGLRGADADADALRQAAQGAAESWPDVPDVGARLRQPRDRLCAGPGPLVAPPAHGGGGDVGAGGRRGAGVPDPQARIHSGRRPGRDQHQHRRARGRDAAVHRRLPEAGRGDSRHGARSELRLLGHRPRRFAERRLRRRATQVLGGPRAEHRGDHRRAAAEVRGDRRRADLRLQPVGDRRLRFAGAVHRASPGL